MWPSGRLVSAQTDADMFFGTPLTEDCTYIYGSVGKMSDNLCGQSHQPLNVRCVSLTSECGSCPNMVSAGDDSYDLNFSFMFDSTGSK